VGSATRIAAQTALGELVIAISAAEAYRLWARTYDDDPNPLLELEHRILKERLHLLPGERLIDLATGTGRWLEYALSHGVAAMGADVCSEMLAVAATKGGVKGRLACADLCALPFAPDSADVAVCSLALGYVDPIELAFREMARIARRIVISDLHPDAVRAGWVRSFRTSNATFEIRHHDHLWPRIETCARAAGLRLLWKIDASFGEAERSLFERAGKAEVYIRAQQVPAILVSAWARG
jgi:ubiquinone/menaquinone biosynthesis C-methylase UbiE